MIYDEASWRKGQRHQRAVKPAAPLRSAQGHFSAPGATFYTHSTKWNNRLTKAGRRRNKVKRKIIFSANIFLFPILQLALKKQNKTNQQKPLKDFQKGKFSFLSNYNTVNPVLKEHFHPSVLLCRSSRRPRQHLRVPPGVWHPRQGPDSRSNHKERIYTPN